MQPGSACLRLAALVYGLTVALGSALVESDARAGDGGAG
jgi:hypothetical protein